jgi:hypothetical protein
MSFDRFKQGQIRKALEKYSVPEDLIAAIEALYSNPAFWTEIDKVRSATHPQTRGIRQGCTLSPYLFIIAMSSLVEMVQRTDDYKQAILEGGIPNTDLLELLYADDTMIISKKTKSMEKILHRLEQFAPHFGLTFNRTKCVHLRLNSEAVINFSDDTEVKIEHEITYLGAKLNDQLNIHKEITAKIQQTMGTWKKLGPYWKKAAIPNRVKLLVYDALIRSKLVYGFETATMNDNAKKRIDAFQLKGLRQILKLKTTFIDRTNTNVRVFELANKAINEGTKHNNKKRKIKSFSAYLEEETTGLFGHVLRAPDADPIRDICFLQNSATPNISGDKRRGRPKLNWVITQMHQVWAKVKTEFTLSEALKLNVSCKTHQDFIRAAADLHVF